MKKASVTVICLLFSLILRSQINTPISLPETVKKGKLKNGMTYFIMHNEEPKDRASFYFSQNVGAILEDDDENGLAHFLEHMAFNGSKNFPNNTLVKYLESKGLLFGRDFNAYTSYDETVYNISNIPVGDKELIDKALLVLHDWSGFLSLKGDAIDAERGVIEEEWRSNRGPRMRLYEKTFPVMFAGSKYAERNIIGDQKFIQSFKHESLRNYYNKWYRPDLQAVVIVGDIDVDAIEKKVIDQFSKIPLAKNAIERPNYHIPASTEMGYGLATDKDAPFTEVNWNFKRPQAKIKDEHYLKNSTIEDLFSTMMSGRLEELTQKADSPALFFATATSSMTVMTRAQQINFIPKEAGKLGESLQMVLEAIERVIKQGFEPSEFERAKLQLLAALEEEIEEEKKKPNDQWATEISTYFFEATPFILSEKKMEMKKKFFSEITLSEVNEIAKRYENIQNSVLTITGPEDDNVTYPSKEDVLEMVKVIKQKRFEKYQDNTNDTPLISEELQILPVKKKFSIKNIDEAKGFVLANGARVVLMPSKKKGTDVELEALSFGGISQLSTKNVKAPQLLEELVRVSGLGGFSSVELDKKLAAKNASTNISLDQYTEGVIGSSSLKDLETLLKLVYLRFEKPNFDHELYSAQKSFLKDYMTQMRKNEESAFRDSISKVIFNNHPRKQPVIAEDVDKFNVNQLEQIYRQRFSDADDFIFVFTGNFNEENVLPLLQKYIGNIKSVKETESWADNNIRRKGGKSSIRFDRKMQNPQSTIFYSKSFSLPYTLENRLMAKMVQAVLDTRYTKTIREEEGGSYGVSANAYMSRIPEERFNVDVYFNCNPAKSEELLQIVKDEINKLIADGPMKEHVDKAKKYLINDIEMTENDDDYWRTAIFDNLMYGDQRVDMNTYKKAVDAITVNKVHEFVKAHFSKKETSAIEILMDPENSKP